MPKQVSYEWGVELRDPQNPEDDFDTDHFEPREFKNAYQSHIQTAGSRLVLIRTEGSHDTGVTDRTWAYFENNKLDEWCRDSRGSPVHKTPQRFMKQSGLNRS